MNKKWIAATLAASVFGLAIAKAPEIDKLRVEATYKVVVQQMAQMGQTALPENEAVEIKKEIAKNLQQADVLKAAALKEGLDQKPEIKAQFANFEAQFYANEYVEYLKQSIQVSDQELLEAYNNATREIRLQNIAFESEEAALKAQELLVKGMTFENLAKQHGDLSNFQSDWLTPQQLPPELANAAQQMVKNEITAKPIQLDGQYFLIRISDTRTTAEKVPFAQMKETLLDQIRTSKVMDKVAKILEEAGVK